MNMDGSSRSGQPVGTGSEGISEDRDEAINPIDVVLAAPDDAIRAELRTRLVQAGGFVIAAEKTNATQALGATLFHSPRVCLLSIDLPGEIDSRIKSIRMERPDTRIGILAQSADQPGLLRAVLAGADGVLLTSDPAPAFIAELGALARGERVIPPEDGDPAAAPEMQSASAVTSVDGLDAESLAAAETLGDPEHTPGFLAAPPSDSWLRATVLYLPRFIHHLRRRLRAGMPFPIAWSSARERMWDYR